MRKPVVITTPYPTVEEIAARSKMSREDVEYLVNLAKDLVHSGKNRGRTARPAVKKRARRK